MRFAFTIVLAAISVVTAAYAGVGQDKYGTREPAICASRAAPPNVQTVTKYLACDMEHESSDEMYLITDVKVQVAKPRPFNMATDSWSDIDPSKPVFNIRGNFKKWQCNAKNSLSWENHPGSACNLYDQPQAAGMCYTDTFGDWHCHMSDVLHNGLTKSNLPPPK